MPCEECNAEFTVFNCKYRCSSCKRYLCHSCLRDLYYLNGSSSSSDGQRYSRVCVLCTIFSRRPLHYADLHNVKTRHLISHLRRRQISTTGCVERDDLIKLVLRDAQIRTPSSQSKSQRSSTSSSSSSSPSSSQRPQPATRKYYDIFEGVEYLEHIDPYEGRPPPNSHKNSTDSSSSTKSTLGYLRQTCQKFFNNLSENLSGPSTSTNSSSKQNRKAQNNHRSNNGNSRSNQENYNTSNVPDQPGLLLEVQFREIPSYGGGGAGAGASVGANIPAPGTSASGMQPRNHSQERINRMPYREREEQTSLVVNLPVESSPESIREKQQEPAPSNSTSGLTTNGGDCKCKDIDLFKQFQVYRRKQQQKSFQNELEEENIRPKYAAGERNSDRVMVVENGIDSLSWHSSFEELGAVGGVDESKQKNFSSEAWQFVDLQAEDDEMKGRMASSRDEQDEQKPSSSRRMKRGNDMKDNYSKEQTTGDVVDGVQKQPSQPSLLNFNDNSYNLPINPGNCHVCGQDRRNIVCRQLEQMRRHLLNSNMSDLEKAQEMRSFLDYMEMRNSSIEVNVTDNNNRGDNNHPSQSSQSIEVDIIMSNTVIIEDDLSDDETEVNNQNNDSGIMGEEKSTTPEKPPSGPKRRKMLDEYGSLNELEQLTVKELKEILVINRVDYRGCCEKQELLMRVKRLWMDMKSTPRVEKLADNELCKICMDAPLECVVLECGHMATCTKCAKTLTECPICRQYIVRVVRFFKA